MERRVILAIVLMLLVALLPSIFFPPKKPTDGRTVGQSDSARAARQQPATPELPVTPPRQEPSVSPTATARQSSRVRPSDTVWVTSSLYRLGFTNQGGQLVWAELREYRSFAPGDSAQQVQLVPAGRPFLAHQFVAGSDTAALADWTFTPSARELHVGTSPATLGFTADRGGARVTLSYTFSPDDYRFDVQGAVSGLGSSGAVLVLGMGDGLRSVEADSADDYRHYAVVTAAAKTQSQSFNSLDPGEVVRLNGPYQWVGIKSKYFLVAALTVEENQSQFGGAVAVGGPRSGKMGTRAGVALTLPVPQTGGFRYGVYAGPLEHRRLARIGHRLDDANPYGGFIRGIIHPVSVFVVNIMVWMHERLHLAYGWVLVFFGVLVRIILWPLNQKAMESGLRMQAVAPLIKETQDRYKGDPERLQKEMMRIYKEHKVNPFGGCLPMLLPMPVLFALFFVFANTIEFRGVPFLWLPDLSRHDPLYIIPVVMGLSMFGLSKVGQMGVPPNPQAKMMLYFLPIMMTVLFFSFASGLNLYYAVSNIFSIPQQYLIARRRLREQGARKPGTS
ncbi:MAG: membrane protein insertase YidC [Gemmatimonadetes bacterium]|nr:membrane protein insertase YidC [Gemmatimonadota bacterium]